MFRNFYSTLFIYFYVVSTALTSNIHGKPNIIIILADDMGWNDVSFHGSDQIPTPNIDALAYNGVILKNHYVQPVCSPSRSALMTGKYPIHNGMQHFLINFDEPRGVPLSDKFLPQYLKEAGYVNHMIGKWHLGFYKKEYTPTHRGFDSHFGYWCGYQSYYNHKAASLANYRGFDMRRNMSVALDTIGRYSTDLYTEEAVRLIEEHDQKDPLFLYLAQVAVHSGLPENLLEAPADVVAKFSYIRDPKRRKYAAMVSKLDESVGEVVAALHRQKMLDNSIILFMSDNGAPTFGQLSNTGSNYPLRGIKNTLWEGGVHGVAAVWSPFIRNTQRVSTHLMHITDWLPTLLSAADIKKKPRDIDGIDMWTTITNGAPNPRSEVVINIDPVDGTSAILCGDYKYIAGSIGIGDSWYGDSGAINYRDDHYSPYNILKSKAGTALREFGIERRGKSGRVGKSRYYWRRRFATDENDLEGALTIRTINKLRSESTLRCNVPKDKRIPCDPRKSPCLFNVKKDPCEMVNLAQSEPEILQQLAERLAEYNATSVPPTNLPEDPKGNPDLWDGIWVNWRDPEPAIF